MKKLAISLLAALALLVCVVTFTAPRAQAAEDTVLYHCICGNKHSTALTDGQITYKEGTTACYDGCDGVILEWTAWGATSTTTSGNYYMISNHTTVRGFTKTGVNINVDMNGYNIEVTGATRAINAGNGSAINYCNTKTTGGLITAPGYENNNGAVIKIYSGTTLNLYGVDVVAYNGGTDTTTIGGAVYVDNLCSFTMHDGIMTGCDVTEKGGSLFLNTSAVAKLYGVTISGGSAGTHGGNVFTNYNSTGTILMDGCTVYGGTAVENGGNIWIGYAAKNEDGSENAELVKFINCTIYGGEAVSGGSVMYGRRIAMNGGSIGVGADGNEAGGVATNRGGNVFINDAELVMNLGAKIGFGNSGSTNGGNVFITGTNGKLTMNNTATVLNGKTTGNGGNVYVNAGSLKMGGSAQISGGDAAYGGNVYMNAGEATMLSDAMIAGGGFTGLYGQNATATCVDGGNVYVNTGAYFLLSGRAIVRNGMDTGVNEQSGNFLVKGTLEIRGASKVYGGLTAGRSGERNIHAVSGGVVNLTNYINDNNECVVNDSAVRGGLTMGAGTSLKLEGAPYIKAHNGGRAMYLANNIVVDATGLSEGAEIEICDFGLPAETDRKIADITAEQTWIKNAITLSSDSTLDCVFSRELVTAEDGTQTVELWLRKAVAAQVETAQNGVYDYQTVDAAIADSTAEETIIIDLKGQTISGYEIPGNLKLIDSANDDYTTQTGSFAGTVNGTLYSLVESNGKSYLVVENEDVYTAHRYDVQLTHISLDAANDALGYKAALNGDEVVMGHVTGFGFNLWVDDGQVKTYAKTGVQELTLRLKNIMAANGGEMNINANAFVAFDVIDEKITTADKTTSMKAVLSAVNDAIAADPAAYTETQVNSVKGLIETYADAMTDWNIAAIQAWTVPEENVPEAA